MLNCPYCGFDKVIRKGGRNRRDGTGYIVYCKSCNHYFTLNPLRHESNSKASAFYEKFFEGKTVRDLASELSTSKSTAHRRVLEVLMEAPSWEEIAKKQLLDYHNRLGDWFKNLVVDTTSIKVGGKRMLYLHAADNYLKLPLIYRLLDYENEKEVLISPELQKLREIGYIPSIVTIDMSRALISAVKNVYGEEIIQLCVFHLEQNLNKKLKIREDEPPNIQLEKEHTKNLVVNTACSDERTRRVLLEELNIFYNSTESKTVKRVIGEFKKNLRYYHPIEKLEGHTEALTTNLCENHIQQIKERLRKRLFGFKSPVTAQKYIDAFWQNYLHNHTKGEWRREDLLSSFVMRGHIPVDKLTRLLGKDHDTLIDMIRASGGKIMQTVEAAYPIADERIDYTVKLATKTPNIAELAKITVMSPHLAYQIIKNYGSKVGLKYLVQVKGILQMRLDNSNDFFQAAKIHVIPQVNCK